MYKEFDLNICWPDHFEKFIVEVRGKYRFANIRVLKEELIRFDATISVLGSHTFLQFKNEQGYILFLLTYS